jgi:hypothetical protein
MLVNRLKTLLRISIILNIFHGTIQATANDVKLSTLLKRRGLEKDSLLHLGDKGKEISADVHPSHTEKLESSDSSQIQDQVEKVNDKLKAVTISAGGKNDPEKTNTIRDRHAKDLEAGTKHGEVLVKYVFHIIAS